MLLSAFPFDKGHPSAGRPQPAQSRASSKTPLLARATSQEMEPGWNELSAEPVREKTSSLLVLSHPASAVAIPHQLRNMLSTIISPCTTRCPVSTTLVPAEGINSHATLSDINFWFSNSIGRCYFSTVTSGYFCTHVTDGFEVKVTQDIKRL